MLHPIHQSPEEKLAHNSGATLSAIQEMHKTMRDTSSSDKQAQKLDEVKSTLQFSSDKQSQKFEDMNSTIKSSGDKQVQKLDEVKSALQEISKKEMPSKMDVVLSGKRDEIASAFFSMLRGDKGDSIKGDKGDTPTDEHLLSLIEPLIPEPIKGDDGQDYILTERDRQQIASKIKVPIVEKVIEKTIIEQPIVKEVAIGDTPDEVVEKVNTASKKIKADRVEGMAGLMREVANYGSNPQGGATGGTNQILIKNNGTLVSAHVTELDFTTNMSLTYGNNGKITVTATGGSSAFYVETPTGAINGSNKIYTTANTITTVLSLHINGQFIHPSEYTASGAGFTMGTALDSSLSGLGFTIIYI